MTDLSNSSPAERSKCVQVTVITSFVGENETAPIWRPLPPPNSALPLSLEKMRRRRVTTPVVPQIVVVPPSVDRKRNKVVFETSTKILDKMTKTPLENMVKSNEERAKRSPSTGRIEKFRGHKSPNPPVVKRLSKVKTIARKTQGSMITVNKIEAFLLEKNSELHMTPLVLMGNDLKKSRVSLTPIPRRSTIRPRNLNKQMSNGRRSISLSPRRPQARAKRGTDEDHESPFKIPGVRTNRRFDLFMRFQKEKADQKRELWQ